MSKKRKLYRYISFEDFINLIVNGKDRFVRPASWDDKYEGYTFSYMQSEEDVRRIVKELYCNVCRENYYAVANNFFRMWHSKWFTYAQCWSYHTETDALWRCYSYGNEAVRIRTDTEKLLNHAKKIFPEEEYFSVYLNKVIYDLRGKSILEKQIEQMKNSLLIHETYFHKRPAFKHEGEYRLLIVDNSLYDAEELASSGVKDKIEDQIKGKTDEEIIDYLTEKIIAQRADWDRMENNNYED